MIRLNKYLSDCGVASRRGADKLIESGAVAVNGEVVTQLGAKISETDEVRCGGKTVKKTPRRDLIYVMLNKPRGYVTTVKDQFDRPAVLDLVKDINARLFPVGRLDYDTTGLLLLTNDGDLTYKLTHPKHNVEKIYTARIAGIPTPEEMNRFAKGVYIEGRRTAPAKIELLKSDERHSIVRVTIKEGRNRQVKKMFNEIGYNVTSLKRVSTGRLTLGKLEPGKYRFLTEREIKYLKSI